MDLIPSPSATFRGINARLSWRTKISRHEDLEDLSVSHPEQGPALAFPDGVSCLQGYRLETALTD